MGVDGLIPFLRKTVPAVLSPRLDLFGIRTLAIDAPLWMSQFLYSGEVNGVEKRDKRIVSGIVALTRSLRRTGVEPIFVFDGALPLKQKAATHALRSRRRSSLGKEARIEGLRRQMSHKTLSMLGLDQHLELGTLSDIRTLKQSCFEFKKRSAIESARSVHEERFGNILDDEVDDDSPQLSLLPLSEEEWTERMEILTAQLKSHADDLLDVSRSMSTSVNLEIQTLQELTEEANYEDAIGFLTAIHIRATIEESKKNRRSDRLNSQDVIFAKRILDVMNVETVQGSHEGEAMCAALVDAGFADATSSEDTDVLLFGEGPLLRRLFSRSDETVQISPLEVHEALGLSSAEFLDFCILLGTDFSGKLMRVGPRTAFKLIRKYGSIESILEAEPQYQPDATWSYQSARQVFTRLREVVPKEVRERLRAKQKLRDAMEPGFVFRGQDIGGFLTEVAEFTDEEVRATIEADWSNPPPEHDESIGLMLTAAAGA
ncbi:hypothetical protein HKX48_006863 [Thoreauomyces humboldtii]|nr:hypothetical protein HKX48_006863 [Thoreauomyces humboldtii]